LGGFPTLFFTLLPPHCSALACRYEIQRKQSSEQRKARKHAQQKLVQLVMAEDDTVLMLQELTERVSRQRDLVEQCDRQAPQRAQLERLTLKQLQQEQALLQSQLRELRAVRIKLEEGLGAAKDPVMSVDRGPSASLQRTRPQLSSLATPSTPGVGSNSSSRKAVAASLPPPPSPGISVRHNEVDHSHGGHGALSRSRTMVEVGSRLPPAQMQMQSPAPATPTRTLSASFATMTLSDQQQVFDTTQRDLERREEATLQKLLALKKKMQQQQQQGQSPAPGNERLPAVRREATMPAMAVSSPVKSKPAAAAAAAAASTSSSEDEDNGDEGDARFRRPVPSRFTAQPAGFSRPQATDPGERSAGQQEKKFLRAVEQQKDRISQIRKAIRAATVIQRAWRRHKQRSGGARFGGRKPAAARK
jgi:hypothetical protein